MGEAHRGWCQNKKKAVRCFSRRGPTSSEKPGPQWALMRLLSRRECSLVSCTDVVPGRKRQGQACPHQSLYSRPRSFGFRHLGMKSHRQENRLSQSGFEDPALKSFSTSSFDVCSMCRVISNAERFSTFWGLQEFFKSLHCSAVWPS